jgi:carbonic anhydrase
MRKTFSILTLAAALAAGLWAEADSGVSADDAWHMLVTGNERFARELAVHPHADSERRRVLSHKQEPFAAVLACTDSRVAPEIIFDQGLGDLLVLRSPAELVKDEAQIGALENAVALSGVHLIVVLGHSHCDELRAAAANQGAEGPRGQLAADLKPALDEAGDRVGGLSGSDLAREAIEKNVLYQMKQILLQSPLIKGKVEDGSVKLIGGVYHLENSRVQWLGEHPSEKAIEEGQRP